MPGGLASGSLDWTSADHIGREERHMTDDELMEIIAALNESNKALLMDLIDRLLSEQIRQEQKPA